MHHIIKTNLHKIVSVSTGENNAAIELARMANDISISIDSIRAAMAAHLVSGVGRSYKKTNPNLLAEERAHVARV